LLGICVLSTNPAIFIVHYFIAELELTHWKILLLELTGFTVAVRLHQTLVIQQLDLCEIQSFSLILKKLVSVTHSQKRYQFFSHLPTLQTNCKGINR
jgi:hypothetical protein